MLDCHCQQRVHQRTAAAAAAAALGLALGVGGQQGQRQGQRQRRCAASLYLVSCHATLALADLANYD